MAEPPTTPSAKDITHLEAMAGTPAKDITLLGAVAGTPAKDIAFIKYEQ